ncbi:hypothetical protein ACFSDD_04410 [Salipiger marinus]|uniref:hypothetical protein n=1 Tax=Salipiger marinus TaxID=555512 RepID=UPI002BE2E0EF|nr:hypothetical protein [Salipiger manganoxidans]MEB3417026.1 hypothetical protein [Salipiger manganoxidans]
MKRLNLACGTGGALSRRALLTALPASTAALAVPSIAPAAPEDPMMPLYRQWMEARRDWLALVTAPGNENWDDPRSLEARDREHAAEAGMLTLTATSLEGIGALAALTWDYISPACIDPVEFAERAQSLECRAVMAIWRACTGLDGYPIT